MKDLMLLDELTNFTGMKERFKTQCVCKQLDLSQ